MAAIGEFVHWVGLPIQLKSKKNQSFVLDRSGTGGNVKIWTNQPGHPNLTFSVDSEGRIHCVDNPDWVIDAGSKNEDKANIYTIQLSKNKSIEHHNRLRWKLHSDGRIESIAYPGKVLDINAGTMKNGTVIILYKYGNTSNQQWIPELVNTQGKDFKGMYNNASKLSSLSVSEFARAWSAPFIMELTIDGYDSCLETPWETFQAPSSKYSVIFCILSIIFVIFASILIYDYVRRNRDMDASVLLEDDGELVDTVE